MPNWNDLNPRGEVFNAMRPRPTKPVASVPRSAVHQIIEVLVPPGKTAVVTFVDVAKPQQQQSSPLPDALHDEIYDHVMAMVPAASDAWPFPVAKRHDPICPETQPLYDPYPSEPTGHGTFEQAYPRQGAEALAEPSPSMGSQSSWTSCIEQLHRLAKLSDRS